MVEPYSKLSAKVIEKTVTEVGRQQNTDTLRPGEDSPFKQMLDSMGSGKEFTQNLGLDNQKIGLAGSNLGAISAEGIPVDVSNMGVGLERPDGISKIVDLLSDVNDGHMQMEGMVNQIMFSERRFSNQELLALQAHMFHFAQVTELVVKVADQGLGSVKAVLQTNIQ